MSGIGDYTTIEKPVFEPEEKMTYAEFSARIVETIHGNGMRGILLPTSWIFKDTEQQIYLDINVKTITEPASKVIH